MSINLTDKPLVEILRVEVKEKSVADPESVDSKPLVCLVCGVCFITAHSLQQHYVNHISLKPYKCKQCDKTFLFESNLVKHEFIHAGLKPYQCDICKKRYSKKLRYEIKCRTHGVEQLCDLCYELFSINPISEFEEEIRHSCDVCNQRYLYKPIVEDSLGYPRLIKPYFCELCGKGFKTQKPLIKHSATHLKPSEKFFCNICNKGFSLLPLLNAHEKSHIQVNVGANGVCYACQLCDLTFPFRKPLEAHYNDSHDGKTKHVCSVCDKMFFFHHLLQSHKYTHIDLRKFSCDFCLKLYKTKQNLAKHRLSHFARSQFSCDICQKLFSSKYSLRQHSVVHTNEKPFKCDYCNVSFNQKKNLERHYLRHVEEKPYKCNKCPASFTRKVGLDNHQEVHVETGKRFECKHCNKNFTMLKFLWRHSRVAHPEVNPYYCCDVCGRIFKHQPSYIRHYKIHTNDRPFKCQHCDKAYIQRIHLVKHHNYNHPNLKINLFYDRQSPFKSKRATQYKNHTF